MIFITLGSQKFQFNRLIEEVDKLVEVGEIKEEVFAQIGYSDYQPQNYKFRQFLDRNSFQEYIEKADLIITHGGTGAIVGSIKKGKKVIAIPRLEKYREHVDNHQIQIVEQFKEMNLISSIIEVEDLIKAIKEIDKKEFKRYKSNTEAIITSIEEYIDNNL